MVKYHLGEKIFMTGSATQKPVKVQIVFAADDNYCQHMTAAMASILLNSRKGNEFVFHVLHGELSDDNKQKIEKLKNLRSFNLYFYDMRNVDFSELPLNRDYISVATYYRLYILDVLPKQLDKVLYMDCDMIAEGDVAELFQTNINRFMAAVAEDEGSKYQSDRMGFAAGVRYFNAGMVLFNLEKMRKTDFRRHCFDWFRKHKKIVILQDQDILNGVFSGKVKYVSLAWNANGRLYRRNEIEHFYSEQEEIEAKQNPKIIHFTDRNKPWHVKCNHPLRYEYWKYLAHTSFAGAVYSYRIKRILYNLCCIHEDFFNKKLKIFGVTLIKIKSIFPKKAWYVLGFPVFSLEKKDFRKIYTIMGCSLAFYDRFEKLNYELETINNNLCRLSSLLEKSVHR